MAEGKKFGQSVEDFKGLHGGKTVFILASGPSLAEIETEGLSRRLTIGLNRSVLKYSDTNYHCVMDHRLFAEFEQELRQTRYLFTLENRPWGIPLKLLGSEGFSEDLSEGVYSGYTISYLALQLAIYMGFKTVIYLGLDLSHDKGQTHFFGADYHSTEHEDTEFPKMKRMMRFGADRASKLGVTLYNCSPISNLLGFKQLSFEQAMRL